MAMPIGWSMAKANPFPTSEYPLAPLTNPYTPGHAERLYAFEG